MSPEVAMEHAEVRERLEAAVLAPGKLQALEADATPDGEELRRHLATCVACNREYGALRETAALLAAAVPDELYAPPGAREAVLRAIRETGVRRPAPMPAAVGADAERASGLRALPTMRSVPATRLAWLGLAAAAILLVVGVLATVDLAAQRDRNAQQARELARVTAASDRLLREPDSHTVVLRDRGGNAAGTVVYSAARRELVVVSDALAEPAGDDLYECFLERGTARTQVGYMRYSNGLAYWAGPVDDFASGAASGERFVVVLKSRAPEPILQGEL
jgi:hypothetical protein